MSTFVLDKQLQMDTHPIAVHQGLHILLHRNATIPWFIVVPETEVAEVFELSSEQSQGLQKLQAILGSYLQKEHHAEKINVAAIGNIVRQLHIHIIGRRSDDPCWPGVVWGVEYQMRDYSKDQLGHIRTQIDALFS